MKDVVTDFVPALRALIVALAGVLIAQWWYDGRWYYAVSLVVGFVVLGFFAESVSDRMLPDHPVGAVRLMEWWILAPMSCAAAGAAVVIVIAVELSVPDSVKDPVVKETTGAVATGLTSFVTAAFISSIGDRDKSAVGNRIKNRIRGHYTRNASDASRRVKLIPAGSRAEQLLHSDFFEGLSGWDRETRMTRVSELAKELSAKSAR